MNTRALKILGAAFVEAAVLSLSIIAFSTTALVVYSSYNLDSPVANLLLSIY